MTNLMESVCKAIFPIEDPPFKVQAALYFLDGHYLFRYQNGERGSASGQVSKFVTAADVAAAFNQKEQDSGWLPPGIVRAGYLPKGKFFVYSAPAQKVDIFLAGEEESLTIPVPRTVLAGVGNQYYLWAMGTKHFDPEGEAFKAPFPNVYEDGKICWGTNPVPEAEAGNARAVWNLFFKLPFNADLAQRKSSEFPEDVRDQLRSLAGKNSYPVKDMYPTIQEIGDLVSGILGVQS